MLYKFDITKNTRPLEWKINAPIEDSVTHAKMIDCRAVTHALFVCLMENYMLWMDLSKQSRKDNSSPE